MDYFDMPVEDIQTDEEASGFCRYCGHVIVPLADPPPEDEPPF
jgi:hypothetical protein